MRRFWKRPPGPMVVALVALFIALDGTNALAAPVTFLLNTANTGSSQTTLNAPVAGKALQITNTNTTAGATALGLNVAAGHAPFTTTSQTKVTNLNADKLDGLDAAAFLRAGAPIALTGAGTGPEIHGTGTAGGTGVQGNSANGNGVVGISTSAAASGVYGENDGSGYGVAGRSTVGGLAGWFDGDVKISGALTVDGSANLDAATLGGFSASDFARGSLVHGSLDQAPGATPGAVLVTANPAYTIRYRCPANLANDGFLIFENESGVNATIYIDKGATFLSTTLGQNQGYQTTATASGYHFTIQVDGAGTSVTTFEAFTVNRATDCHAQVEAWTSR